MKHLTDEQKAEQAALVIGQYYWCRHRWQLSRDPWRIVIVTGKNWRGHVCSALNVGYTCENLETDNYHDFRVIEMPLLPPADQMPSDKPPKMGSLTTVLIAATVMGMNRP